MTLMPEFPLPVSQWEMREEVQRDESHPRKVGCISGIGETCREDFGRTAISSLPPPRLKTTMAALCQGSSLSVHRLPTPWCVRGIFHVALINTFAQMQFLLVTLLDSFSSVTEVLVSDFASFCESASVVCYIKYPPVFKMEMCHRFGIADLSPNISAPSSAASQWFMSL